MAPGGLKRRCQACYGQKKGCDGGNPCEYCRANSIPCIQYIGKRERKQAITQDMEDRGDYTPPQRPAKRRKTEKRPAETPARKGSGEEQELATTTHDVPIVFSNAWWILRVTLKYTQHSKYSCCTNILATFWLLVEDGDHLEVGELKSAIINKTGDAWVLELLDPMGCSRQLLITHDQRDRSRVGEMNRVFQIFFDENGQISEDERFQPEIQYLNGDKIHYVSTFKVNAQLRGTGLGEAALTLYHFAITRGPHAFSGYSILSPAALNEEYHPYVQQMLADRKVPKSYLGVEDALIDFYAKLLYYAVVLGDRKDRGRGLTVVARTLSWATATIELELLKEVMSAQMPVTNSVTAISNGMTRRNWLKLLHDNVLKQEGTAAQTVTRYKQKLNEYGRTLKRQVAQRNEVNQRRQRDPQYNRRRPRVVKLDDPTPMPHDEAAWYHKIAMAFCSLATDGPNAGHHEGAVARTGRIRDNNAGGATISGGEQQAEHVSAVIHAPGPAEENNATDAAHEEHGTEEKLDDRDKDEEGDMI